MAKERGKNVQSRTFNYFLPQSWPREAKIFNWLSIASETVGQRYSDLKSTGISDRFRSSQPVSPRSVRLFFLGNRRRAAARRRGTRIVTPGRGKGKTIRLYSSHFRGPFIRKSVLKLRRVVFSKVFSVPERRLRFEVRIFEGTRTVLFVCHVDRLFISKILG